ncbi:MAG: divalent metal cation transporter [Planctomycetota bacterium]|nr:MAG: divalent metal cation transporter [Planctomycetota bacterium]
MTTDSQPVDQDATLRASSAPTGLWSMLGPGLMWAAAAVGVSHLVASTRAGALFGFALIALAVVVNIAKYPFFEYAQRYTAATGEDLLAGYRRLGRFWLGLFITSGLIAGSIVLAAVSFVCAALLTIFTGDSINVTLLACGIMAVTVVLIASGGYRVMDGVVKIMMATLALCTLVALVMAIASGARVADEGFVAASPYALAFLPFLIAFMGYMPAPIEINTWSSLWMREQSESKGGMATPQQARRDFHVGYIGCALLAICFLSLGALVMHGSSEPFPTSAVGFANMFVSMYTESIGAWAWWIVGLAAVCTMFSTVVTCFDGYPGSIGLAIQHWQGQAVQRSRSLHLFLMVLMGLAGTVILLFFRGQLLPLVDLSMIIAFVTAPLFAWATMRVMALQHVPDAQRPPAWMRGLAWIGLVFLMCFTAMYLAWLVGLLQA